MPREAYQERLQELRGEVGAMADRTLDQYEAAVEVLESGDEQRARTIIEGDEALNQWSLDLESDCVELLALQQPAASDLRFVASSFKIVTDLERIGDLATNLAAYGRDADGDLFPTVDPGPIATCAGKMVKEAMDAYAVGDADRARSIAARDDTLDELSMQASESVVRALVAMEKMGDVDATIDDVSRALLTIRDLERVGDHAVNICARTVYIVESDDELIY